MILCELIEFVTIAGNKMICLITVWKYKENSGTFFRIYFFLVITLFELIVAIVLILN